MTASVTMRMWRSMSCASWRPDPRHPRRFAPAVRVGLPSRSLSEDFNGLGRTPERVHADVVAAPEVIHSSACTNLTPSYAQTPVVNTDRPAGTDHPTHQLRIETCLRVTHVRTEGVDLGDAGPRLGTVRSFHPHPDRFGPGRGCRLRAPPRQPRQCVAIAELLRANRSSPNGGGAPTLTPIVSPSPPNRTVTKYASTVT